MALKFITLEETEKLEKLSNYAQENPLSMDDLLDTYNKVLPPVGDNKNHTVMLACGFKVVFSVEQQPKGDVRHLSVSTDNVGKLPSIESVRIIIQLVGFKQNLEKCLVYFEDIALNHQAINIVEFI